MPPPGTQLYFIALIPPSPIFEEALSLKEYLHDQYGCKAALNSPPHITLHMPFQWKEKKEGKLTEALEKFSIGKRTFQVSFRDFSCFAPKVIYIDVKPCELLDTLQHDLHRFCKTKLNLFNAQYRDLPFHPHVTLAFRDLKKDMFLRAWEEFQSKKFAGDFSVDKITLLKHDGKKWQRFREFGF